MNTKRLRIRFLLLLPLSLSACNKKQANAPNSSQASPQSSNDPANAPTSQLTPAPGPASTPASAPALSPEPVPPPPPPPVVIPAGTVLSVRLRQAVGSKTSTEGDRFRTTLTD